MDGEGFGDMEKQQDVLDHELVDQWYEPAGSAEDADQAGGFVKPLRRQNAFASRRKAAGGKRPAKRPARALSPLSDDEDSSEHKRHREEDELDIGGYLREFGMNYKQQILYCRAYASMLAAKLKAEGRHPRARE